MLFTKTFMNKIINRLDDFSKRLADIEEKLASDRRAVPVLKETVKDLRKDNKEMMNRVMSRDFEQLQIYTAHEAEPKEPGPLVLDEGFAGEIVDLEKLENRHNEIKSG